MSNVRYIEKADLQAMILQSPDHSILVFRGISYLQSREDILTNARFRKFKGIHRGYRTKVFDAIQDIY